eukprot:gene55-43_t
MSASSASVPPAASASDAPMDLSGPDVDESDITKLPTVVIVIGMAGSGKTRFVHRLMTHLVSVAKKRTYAVNLDPAVSMVPYPCNIDIRDTVNYKEVMKHFQLGPNGGIMTSLNLFATRFDQVLGLIDQRAKDLDYIVIDTPGQLEVFNWSASGSIITDSLAVAYPTTCVYVTDTVRCLKPVSFMSNMLYACSILYRCKIPLICAFNKTDVHSADFAMEWMKDFTKYGEALQNESTYISSLSRSMSLVMEEFYGTLRTAAVSAATGDGFDDFLSKLAESRQEFIELFIPYLKDQAQSLEEKRQKFIAERQEEVEKQFQIRKDQNDDDDEELEAFRKLFGQASMAA